MALQPPCAVDNQEIQFKLQNKHIIFPEGQLHNNVSLLSVSSTEGLLFAGNPNAPELKVFMLVNLLESYMAGKKPLVRNVSLPSAPHALAVNADGQMLAINYMQNDNSVLQVYNVRSFGETQLINLYSVRLSAENDVKALQLLWNPVLTNMLAIVLSNGALIMYNFKEAGQFELHTLDKSNNVQCGCWSPKGKQIVLGFPNGKLQQFKPDLTPAKSIICPAQVHPLPFDTIAVHWLSTYQFAVVFLEKNAEANPSLYIVNAPKGGQPSYVSYEDVCYSASGPRAHQFTFTHVPQWNLLLVCSANGVEVGVLATKESGDTPQWQQYLLLDETRIELPLNKSKDETYPIGFCFNTAATHQLMLGEQQLPVMPMIHVLSTHGHLVSFNFLNLTPNAPDVCSPPRPFADECGQFVELKDVEEVIKKPATPAAENTFTLPQGTVASTPKEKSTTFFGSNTASTEKETTTPGFGAGFFNQPPVTASAPNMTFGNKPNSMTNKPTSDTGGFSLTKSTSTTTANTMINNEKSSKDLEKPLYTVPPTFVPPAATETATTTTNNDKNAVQMNCDEIDELVQQMINIQITAFSEEIKQLSNAFTTNIDGNLDEVKQYTRRLNDLQEIIEQAEDHSFEMDVQNLRHSLSESFAMLTEFRSKLEQYKNPDLTPLATMTNFEAMDKRQVAKLQSYLANNEAQLQQAQLQIDTQWSNFQDIIRRNTKHKMHIPCLDGIYQRMTKLKDMLASQRVKINFIHNKLKQNGFYYKPTGLETHSTKLKDMTLNSLAQETVMESLTDSILSMSISQAVQESRAKLSPQKLQSIRQILEQRQHIVLIKPRRPNRVDLNSEVILETKLRSQRALREGATASLDKMLQQQEPQKSEKFNFENKPTNLPMGLAKPTATKATANLPTPNATKSFNFGANSSSFVKTSAASNLNNQNDLEKPAFAAVGGGAYNFSLPKGTTVSATPMSSQTALETSTTAIPISFAAKVIGGDANKPTMSSLSQASFKPDFGKNSFAALSGINTSTTASATTTTSSNQSEVKTQEAKPLFNTPFTASFGLKTTGSAPAFNFGGPPVNTSLASSTPTTKPAFAGFATNSTTARKPEAAVPVSAFSGFGKTIGELATLAATLSPTITTTTTAPISNNNTLAFATKTTASVTAPANTAVSAKPTTTEKSNAVAATTPTSAPAVALTSTTSSAADDLLAGLNVCGPVKEKEKPKEDDKPTNIFGSSNFSFGGTNVDFGKPIFGVAATTAATMTPTITTTTTTAPTPTPTTTLTTSTVESTFTFTNALGNLAKSMEAASTTATTTPSTSTNNSILSTPSATIAATTTPTPTTTPSIFTGIAKPTTTTATTGLAAGFQAMSTNAPTFATASSAATPLFGSASVFSNATTTSSVTPSPFATNSVFGVASPTSAAPPTGLFATAAAVATPPTTSTNIFGSIPKPEQSIFGNTQSQPASSDNIFANAAQTTSPFSMFGNNANNNSFGTPNAGSIFGGGAAAATTNNSIFGGSNANQNQTESLFGSSANKSAEGGNLFGGGTSLFSQNQTSPGFGGSAFGVKPATFGQTGSIFGGGMQNNAASTGSIFGGGSSGGGFGSPPSGGGFGAAAPAGPFAQGGASVAQTGFASSPAAGNTFGKGVFGGAPTFGSPPAFGAQPSFGGGPLFGGTKSFGSFGSPTATPLQNSAFPTAAPKDNIFEQLGAQDSTLSFGNLAQNTNANAPPKPAFGGSSFMKYRA